MEIRTFEQIKKMGLSPKQLRIGEIIKELSSLDYKTIKRSQGHYTDEEWITHVAYCDALRDELNGLE